MAAELTLIGATYAHPDVDTAARAELTLSFDRLNAALEEFADRGLDVFVMATCLRVEVVTTGCESALRHVLEWLFPGVDLPFPVIRRNSDVLQHLARVGAGLESPILGEEEVLSQMRSAIEMGREAGCLRGTFAKVLDAAVATARAARKELPESAAGSMAIVAADIAADADRVAVLGAGKMAHAAVKLLRARGIKTIVYARRPDAVAFKTDDVRHMEDAPEALANEAVVISATASKRELFAREVLEAALNVRTEPLTLIDLAMPPDFEPGADTPLLDYYNLDDLAVHVRRIHTPHDVERMVADDAAERWTRISNNNEVGPVIQAILAEARRAVDEEVGRFSNKRDFDPNEIAVLTQLANTVAHRVLHRPLSYLSSNEDGARVAPICAEMFGVGGGD